MTKIVVFFPLAIAVFHGENDVPKHQHLLGFHSVSMCKQLFCGGYFMEKKWDLMGFCWRPFHDMALSDKCVIP